MLKLKIENIDIGKVYDDNKTIHLEINYPRRNEIDTVEIGLCDVRSSDNIRIKYDFERDGWIILQPRGYHPKLSENSYDYAEEWIESAFCPAWKYDLPEDEKFTYKPKK